MSSPKYWRRSLWPSITYSAPVDFTIAALTSPVYAPLSCAEQSSAPSFTSSGLRTACTDVRWVKGTHAITSQLALWSSRSALTAFASSTPSSRVVFIFQLPATIFFLILLKYYEDGILLSIHKIKSNFPNFQGFRNLSTLFRTILLDSCRKERCDAPHRRRFNSRRHL